MNAQPLRLQNRKAVLHVSEAYGGGVQAAIQQYVQNSPGLKHRLLVRNRVAHDIDIESGIEETSFDGSVVSFLFAARREILRTKPQIVHLHSSFAGLLRIFKFDPEVKVIYTPHAYAFLREDCSLTARLSFKLIEIALSTTTQTIAAISPFEVAQAVRMAGRRATVKYLPNIVSNIGENPQDQSSASYRGEIVTVGRISPQKDPGFFAESARCSKLDLRWTWVGDGDPEAKAQLREAGVIVTGWLPNSMVQRYVGSADLYLHTAKWEGAPVTLLEAAALGTPVLARNIVSLTGLGYAFAGETPQGVAMAVDRFFEDRSYRDYINATTIESVGVHSTEAQSLALADLYGGEK
jgi:glycosyltransferase involved in cell wall biosynthesis